MASIGATEIAVLGIGTLGVTEATGLTNFTGNDGKQKEKRSNPGLSLPRGRLPNFAPNIKFPEFKAPNFEAPSFAPNIQFPEFGVKGTKEEGQKIIEDVTKQKEKVTDKLGGKEPLFKIPPLVDDQAIQEGSRNFGQTTGRTLANLPIGIGEGFFNAFRDVGRAQAEGFENAVGTDFAIGSGGKWFKPIGWRKDLNSWARSEFSRGARSGGKATKKKPSKNKKARSSSGPKNTGSVSQSSEEGQDIINATGGVKDLGSTKKKSSKTLKVEPSSVPEFREPTESAPEAPGRGFNAGRFSL